MFIFVAGCLQFLMEQCTIADFIHKKRRSKLLLKGARKQADETPEMIFIRLNYYLFGSLPAHHSKPKLNEKKKS